MHRRLREELEPVERRFRRLHSWLAVAGGSGIAAAFGLGLLAVMMITGSSVPYARLIVACTGGLLALVGLVWARRFGREPLWLARRIERAFPDLNARLLAAIDQAPQPGESRLGYLQANVIHEAVSHAKRHSWRSTVPRSHVFGSFLLAAAAVGLLVGVCAVLRPSRAAASAVAGQVDGVASPSSGSFAMTIEPGSTEIEKGTSLLVLARIVGELPAEAALFWHAPQADVNRVAMSRSLNDPVFGGRVPVVDAPLDYHVTAGDQTSPTYHVDVFEYPRLERADAKLLYPKYTGMEERLVQDVRTVSVVEGTELTLIANLNKPVATAKLLEEGAAPIVLEPVAGEKPVWSVKIACDRTRKLTFELVDDRGRKNVKPSSLTINVVPNLPVALKPVFPARDLEASPLEELDLKATAWDDYGVSKFGVTYELAGRDATEVLLGENAAAREKHELQQTLRLEELGAAPDESLSYHWWAEDLDDAGKPRRVESDMYFAEVRHFEEIFRQGEQPPGGQQQQQQQQRQQGQSPNEQSAQQLAQLQKDIINATWKVIRRETDAELTDGFANDVSEIGTSQETAIGQVETLMERLQDPESQVHASDVLNAMNSAVTELKAAAGGPSRDPLRAALKAEQAAYQALLKLREREHRVTRQQRNAQGQQASARSQQQRQQLDQLDLKPDENPYETQRQAQAQQPETPEDRENRQVLNRLRELARRQHDLNERLKELQAALEEARDAERQEELRRQLKRLQEEQRQVLQDTEELQARMDQPENQERMAEERQQLDQTRDQVQRASEAIEQEMVTQAAAAGSRAEQQFEDLRNEFRRRASNRFSEEMQQMRNAAQELDRRQQELSRELSGQPREGEETKAPSLQEDDNREQVAEDLAEQRQRLSGLQDQMKQTIEDAEQTEPLLSEKLYETARDAQQQNVDRALEATEQSLRRGLVDDARQIEPIAGRGITQLREGIERAAESVLGDETEALRRAREELENLSRELDNEIARNDPEARQPSASEAPAGQSPEGDPQAGQRPGAEGNPLESLIPREAGEPREGEQPGRPGQGRPAEESPDPNSRPQGESETQRPEGEQQGRPAGTPGGTPESPPQGEPQPSTQPGRGNEPRGQRPEGQGQGQQPPEGQTPGSEPQTPEGQGQEQREGQNPEGQAGGNRPPGSPGGRPQAGNRNANERDGRRLSDPSETGGSTGPDLTPSPEFAPITGENFRDWSDRLRDVEEMVSDPELRAEAARIRDRARAVRAEFKRHSKTPQWDLVNEQVLLPLKELRNRVSDEVLRRSSKRALVPLDRDPVPPAYAEKTRQYYERLGTGQ